MPSFLRNHRLPTAGLATVAMLLCASAATGEKYQISLKNKKKGSNVKVYSGSTMPRSWDSPTIVGDNLANTSGNGGSGAGGRGQVKMQDLKACTHEGEYLSVLVQLVNQRHPHDPLTEGEIAAIEEGAAKELKTAFKRRSLLRGDLGKLLKRISKITGKDVNLGVGRIEIDLAQNGKYEPLDEGLDVTFEPWETAQTPGEMFEIFWKTTMAMLDNFVGKRDPNAQVPRKEVIKGRISPYLVQYITVRDDQTLTEEERDLKLEALVDRIQSGWRR